MNIRNIINTHWVRANNNIIGMDAELVIVDGRYIVDDGSDLYEIDHRDLGVNLGDLVIFEGLPVVIQADHIYTPAILQVCDGDQCVNIFTHAGICIAYSIDEDGVVHVTRNFVNLWDQFN